MISKKKIFFGVVILLVIFLVAINFDRFTGEYVRSPGEVTKIIVYPKEISAGEKIYVEIFPGAHCTELEATIQSVDKKFALIRWKEPQSHSRYCDPTNISYKTWSSWEAGEYIVKLKDIGTEEFVKDNFFITG